MEALLGKRSWKLRPFAQAGVDGMMLWTDTDIRRPFRTEEQVRDGSFFGLGVSIEGGAAYRLSDHFRARLSLATVRGSIDRYDPDVSDDTQSDNIGGATYSRSSLKIGVVYVIPN